MLFEKSRYTFCEVFRDDDGVLFLDARKPYRYRAFADNSVHIVKDGESIWSIAGHHFQPHPRAAGLWWIIGDFQPNPIHDPTVRLSAGTVLILPNLRTVYSEILNEERRQESRL